VKIEKASYLSKLQEHDNEGIAKKLHSFLVSGTKVVLGPAPQLI